MHEVEMADFLDSNIVLYAMSGGGAKCATAHRLLASAPCISTQVINECSHVMRRKLLWEPTRIATELGFVIDLTQVIEFGINEIRAAWRIGERYGYGHYDSLIIATAIAAGCATLYTEDMQHGQVIDGRMMLINPFL